MEQQPNENSHASAQSRAEGANLTDVLERDFEAWWEVEGQFLRAGGGEYEKTFAYHAWVHATLAERKACVKLCDEHAADYAVVGLAMYDRMETGARSCAAAIRERV